MLEFIMHYWLDVVFGLIISGVVYTVKTVQKKIKRTINDQESVKMGLQAILRQDIINIYQKVIDRGFIYIYELESVEAMYTQYHNLGGNGVITKIMEKIRNLEMKLSEEED